MANQVVWLDIPVLDLDRAMGFYSAVLGAPVTKNKYPGAVIGMLPGDGDDVTGCLYSSETHVPSAQGPLVYFNCKGRLDEAIAAVETAGGAVVEAKHEIGPYGFRAIILDSEGNRVALHSD